MKDNSFDDLYLKKVLAGDVNAFRHFIKMYQEMAISVALSMLKDEVVAKEVVHEAFVQAFKKLRAYNRDSLFSTWLYRIVVNQALTYLRKNKRRFEYLDTLDHSTIDLKSDGDGLDILNLQDRKTQIKNALLLMKPKESLMLELFYLKELSIKEIEQCTGFSQGNIKILLHRARKNFSSFFTKSEL